MTPPDQVSSAFEAELVQNAAERSAREKLSGLTSMQTVIDVPDVQKFGEKITAAAALLSAGVSFTAMGKTPGRYVVAVFPAQEPPHADPDAARD